MSASFRAAAPPLRGAAFASPLGGIAAVVDASGALVALDFLREGYDPPGDGHWKDRAVARDAAAIAAVRRQIDEYFARKRRDFDLALAPSGTEFQRAVWAALCDIPYGETISYLELARRIGQPTATRAVGRTNGLNPISIVVPCHRVIGADGSLTGYGGGLERKARLLELEGARAAREPELPLARAR